MEAEKLNKHRTARRRSFQPSITLDGFLDEEQTLLKKYGAWMDALAKGEIEPYTQEQSHFVAVANQEENPVTRFELVWKKYCQLVHQHQQIERNRILDLVRNHQLSYERLRLVLDNASKFGFCKDELNLITEELTRAYPRGVSADSFVVFSTTDGQ